MLDIFLAGTICIDGTFEVPQYVALDRDIRIYDTFSASLYLASRSYPPRTSATWAAKGATPPSLLTVHVH